MKPILWISKKYIEEQIRIETKELKDKVSELEKENISQNYSISDYKERIGKLEDRLREFEIKATSVETAISVARLLSDKSNQNSSLLRTERRSTNE